MNPFRFFLLLILLCENSFSQTDSSLKKNAFVLNINYPFPNSAVTFAHNYLGVANISLEYQRNIYNGLTSGVAFDFSQLSINKNIIEMNTVLKVYNPMLGLGYQILLFDKILTNTAVNAGYAIINYSNKDFSGNFSESGFTLQPALNFSYLISAHFGVGANASYKIIFQHFGNDSVMEDNTIRFFNSGISLLYRL